MSAHTPKPPWIRSIIPCNAKNAAIKKLLRQNNLITVCEEAACPNLGECFNAGTATFMIMGSICTRNCRFCNIASNKKPLALDPKEPTNLAQAIKKMNLKYVVITSVSRDDLADGGAEHFVKCIKEIKQGLPHIKVEILTPDFRYNMELALKILGETLPDVFNHNIETVPRLYSSVRPQANYQSSLLLLQKHKELYPNIPTKSGLMLGLGEDVDEVENVLKDLRGNNVDILTIGQYLQPTRNHLEVVRYVRPEEFIDLGKLAYKIGFKHVTSSPLARSSYRAETLLDIN
jgi:lipoyl synthase